LTQRSEPELQSITFHRYADSDTTTDDPPPELRFDSDILKALQKARSLGPIKVGNALRDPHELVAAAKTRIEYEAAVRKIPWSERLHRRERKFGPTITINVSDASLGRALRSMDALIKRLEAIGGGVALERDCYSQYATNTVVRICDEHVNQIRMREKSKQVRISDPDAKYDWDRNRTELVPTGILLIDDGPSSYHPPLVIDTKAKKIEEKLEAMVIEMVMQAGERRIRRRLQEEHELELRELEELRREREAEIKRRQEDLDRLKAVERKRVEGLVHQAESWEKSKLIREFLDALCDAYVAKEEVVPLDSDLARYLR